MRCRECRRCAGSFRRVDIWPSSPGNKVVRTIRLQKSNRMDSFIDLVRLWQAAVASQAAHLIPVLQQLV